MEYEITFSSGITHFCRHIQFITSEQQDPKLGGFSIGYVHVISELTDSQISSSSPVGTTFLSLYPVLYL